MYHCRKVDTRQVSSMILSARPIVTPVANIVFYCFVFLDFEKWGRAYVQHVRKQLSLPAVILGWLSGSIEISNCLVFIQILIYFSTRAKFVYVCVCVSMYQISKNITVPLLWFTFLLNTLFSTRVSTFCSRCAAIIFKEFYNFQKFTGLP